ncbi:MAG: hypothetical protein Kow00133_18850 [Amphiplicatus sp.]
MANVFNKPFRRTGLAILIGSAFATAAAAFETESYSGASLHEINAHLDGVYTRLSQRTLLVAEERVASLARGRDGLTDADAADRAGETAGAALAY